MTGTPWLERAAAARDAIYGPPLPGGLRVVGTDADTYWERHEAELRSVFPPEVYFRLDGAGDAAQPDAPLPTVSDHLLLLDGERLVGVTSGYASGEQRGLYWTNHTTLHPDYRGRGVYAELQRRVIAYTAALGFTAIDSNHAPSNNAPIIVKLRAGFHVVALELDAAWGPVLRLRYFHDPAAHAAYLFRNGLATLTPELIREGFGGMDALRAQFRAADAT